MATPARVRLRRGLIALVALVSLTGAATVLGSAPAYADPTLAVASSPGNIGLTVGGDPQNLNITITVTEPVANAKVDIQVPLTDAGVTVKGTSGAQCQTGDSGTLHCETGVMQPNQSKALTVSLAPPGDSDIEPGQNKSGAGQVQVSADRAQPMTSSYSVSLTNDKPNSVGAISGNVTNTADGKPVSGATVTMTDSANHTQTVTTDEQGAFSWQPSDSQVLEPGTVKVKITASGFKDKSDSQQATAGEPLTFGNIQLVKTVVPHTEKPTTKAAPTAAEAAPTKDGGLSVVTWLLIILGSLLVIGGIIAIILLLRKKDGDDGDGDGGDGDGQGPLLPFDDSRPGYRNDASATSVMAPVPGNDTPTVVHNGPLVRDEYDDYDNFSRNYGTNSYQAGGPSTPYAGETQVYGAQPAGGATQQYGEPTGRTQPYAGETRQYGGQPAGAPYAGETQQRDARPPAGPAQPWQQSDAGQSEGTMYGNRGGAAQQPPSNDPGYRQQGQYGGPAPTSGPGYQQQAGYGQQSQYPAQTSGGAPSQYGQPTSGAAPTSGYPAPTSGPGYQPYGQPAGGAPTSGGPGYLTPGGNYGDPGPSGGAPQQYGQQTAGRPDVNDPTRTWQPNQQPQPPQAQQPPQRGGGRPTGDETRLDRADGVDWLDG